LAVLGTIPILSYYASILYLEPFAVLLVVIVCLRAQFLPGENVDQFKRDIGWYALITVGFVKETAFIFLACFLVVRLITRWLHRNRESLSNDEIKPRVDWWISTFIDALKQEIAVITSLLLPLLIYLWLRFQFLETRSFAPNPAILADGQIYPVIARSVWEQFGGMIFLFFGGLGVFVWRKEYRSAIFFLLLFIAYPLFHAIDSQSYVGYSRFNLFLSGPILASSVVFINRVASQKKIFGALLGVALLAINSVYSPLLPDGTKKAHWGIYLSGISEEYYPYQEAFDWLEQEHRNSKILFAGFNYPYPFEFYFAKDNWNPPYRTLLVNGAMNETETLNDAVEKADLREMNVIVFHVLENEAALPFRVGDFEQEKTIRNLSHSIVVYNKFSKEK